MNKYIVCISIFINSIAFSSNTHPCDALLNIFNEKPDWPKLEVLKNQCESYLKNGPDAIVIQILSKNLKSEFAEAHRAKLQERHDLINDLKVILNDLKSELAKNSTSENDFYDSLLSRWEEIRSSFIELQTKGLEIYYNDSLRSDVRKLSDLRDKPLLNEAQTALRAFFDNLTLFKDQSNIVVSNIDLSIKDLLDHANTVIVSEQSNAHMQAAAAVKDEVLAGISAEVLESKINIMWMRFLLQNKISIALLKIDKKIIDGRIYSARDNISALDSLISTLFLYLPNTLKDILQKNELYLNTKESLRLQTHKLNQHPVAISQLISFADSLHSKLDQNISTCARELPSIQPRWTQLKNDYFDFKKNYQSLSSQVSNVVLESWLDKAESIQEMCEL